MKRVIKLDAIPAPVAGRVYEHYKGHRYTVIEIACHSVTLEAMVVYRHDSDSVWVRPLDGPGGWCEPLADGSPRFKELLNTLDSGEPNE